METLAVGTKAFIDGFTALVPCKVTAIASAARPNNYDEQVTVVVTSKRPGYKLNEVVTMSAAAIVPRKSVYRSRQHCGQYRVRAYRVAV